MKLYLQKNDYEGKTAPAVHGVDYTKGLEDGRECGKIHRFCTRGCEPVIWPEDVLTKRELEGERYIEVWNLNGRGFTPSEIFEAVAKLEA